MNGASILARIRLFLLAVMCWLCLVPAAHAIRPPSPAELQLKEETPGQQPLAYWSDAVWDVEMRNGLLVLNNPLRYTDPDGRAPSDWANSWSGQINAGAGVISASPSHWIWNGTVGTIQSLGNGIPDALRFGSTAGALSGSDHVTAGQVAIGTVQEVGRAATLVPVGAAIGKGAGTVAGVVAGTVESEAAGTVASQVGNAAQKVGAAAGKANQAGGAAAQTTSKVDNLLQQIEQSGAKVKLNPKTASQEGNVTLDFGQQGRVNVRVETHPLTPNGPPVRHANVETVTEAAGKKTVENIHITQ